MAKAVNVLRRARRGVLWEPGQLSIVELKTPDAVVNAIAYCIVNPVAAGLVWSPEDWPGLSTSAADLGQRTLSGVLPDFYFRPKRWSAAASVDVTVPACLREHGDDEARRLVPRPARGRAPARRRPRRHQG